MIWFLFSHARVHFLIMHLQFSSQDEYGLSQ